MFLKSFNISRYQTFNTRFVYENIVSSSANKVKIRLDVHEQHIGVRISSAERDRLKRRQVLCTTTRL